MLVIYNYELAKNYMIFTITWSTSLMTPYENPDLMFTINFSYEATKFHYYYIKTVESNRVFRFYNVESKNHGNVAI